MARKYVNVTEAFWDVRCTPAPGVLDFLEDRGVKLHHPELAAFVPEVLWQNRGAHF